MDSFVAILLCLAVLPLVVADVTMDPLSTVYIPYKYKRDGPKHALFKDAAEQIDFDPVHKMAYSIGGSGLLHVIDMSDPSNMAVVHHEQVEGVPNDLDVCGRWVALSVRDQFTPLPGKAVFFSLFDRETGTMERVLEVPIGASPASAIVFSRDCRTVLVANEGEAGLDAEGNFLDPEGSISIIKFDSDDVLGNFTVQTADFTKFDDRADEYVKRGVRWAYHGERSGERTRFSQDIEPEWISLSPDEKTAYITLQENNAMATVNIETAEVMDMFPLGYKDWSKSGLDASDRDGAINIQAWPIRGLYQPDATRLFVHNNATYLVTANEGDAKKYKKKDDGINWTEKARGRVFVEGGLLDESVPQNLIDAMKDDNKLGRLYFSLVDGRDSEFSKVKDLYAYGGRSFSLWNTDDISLVYDSGNDFEVQHARHYPDVFNNHVNSRQHTPEQDFDTRSDDMGPEVEIVETAHWGDRTFIFVGNQRVSSMMVYSVGEDVSQPRFEGIFRAGGRNRTWVELFEDRDVGDLNVQDMRYISPSESPNGRPLLLLSGSVSGTLTVYQIGFPMPATPTCLEMDLPAAQSTSATSLEMLLENNLCPEGVCLAKPTKGTSSATWCAGIGAESGQGCVQQ